MRIAAGAPCVHIDPGLDIRPTAARAWDPGLLAEPGAGPGARDCLPPPPPAPSALISGVRAGVVRAGACVAQQPLADSHIDHLLVRTGITC